MQYTVAANLFRGEHLVAAAVVYSTAAAEPSFSYTLNGRSRTAFLYRRGDHIPASLYAALDAHIRSTAISWSVVTAHPACPPEAALSLAVIRAVERWVCRQDTLPRLAEMHLILPTRHKLVDLPGNLEQVTRSKDWRLAAARAMCKYKSFQEL